MQDTICNSNSPKKFQIILQIFRIVFTARIRRMGEGNILSLCVSSHLDGGGGGEVLPSEAGGGPTFQGWAGITFPGWGGGTTSR